jgi:hypothetical protein
VFLYGKPSKNIKKGKSADGSIHVLESRWPFWILLLPPVVTKPDPKKLLKSGS